MPGGAINFAQGPLLEGHV